MSIWEEEVPQEMIDMLRNSNSAHKGSGSKLMELGLLVKASCLVF